MTIAIGINFGAYVLMAADTRTTTYNQAGNSNGFFDTSEKIVKTKIGLMTGAGNIALLNAVKKRLSDEEVWNTNEIVKVIKEERTRILELSELFYPISYKMISDSTGWLFTAFSQKAPGFQAWG